MARPACRLIQRGSISMRLSLKVGAGRSRVRNCEVGAWQLLPPPPAPVPPAHRGDCDAGTDAVRDDRFDDERAAVVEAFPHRKPAVIGCSGAPAISVARPVSSTVTSIAHVSGQSCGTRRARRARSCRAASSAPSADRARRSGRAPRSAGAARSSYPSIRRGRRSLPPRPARRGRRRSGADARSTWSRPDRGRG